VNEQTKCDHVANEISAETNGQQEKREDHREVPLPSRRASSSLFETKGSQALRGGCFIVLRTTLFFSHDLDDESIRSLRDSAAETIRNYSLHPDHIKHEAISACKHSGLGAVSQCTKSLIPCPRPYLHLFFLTGIVVWGHWKVADSFSIRIDYEGYHLSVLFAHILDQSDRDYWMGAC
jgi:hypothetical protein